MKRRFHRIAAGLAVVASLTVALTGCGPPIRARVGVSATAQGPIAIVWVCDEQPALTVLVIYRPKTGQYYSLTGHARKRERVAIPLTTSSQNWLLTGTRADLPAGTTIELDLLDGDGYRLEASVFFRLDRLPASPRIEVGNGGRSGPFNVVTPSAFLSQTTCEF